ncbi:MAG: hypothetical protein IKS41_00430 [Alphaproteobacteria bacterium]|nr:hypothetical protein [Alphaproteobacteria bacterium]
MMHYKWCSDNIIRKMILSSICGMTVLCFAAKVSAQTSLQSELLTFIEKNPFSDTKKVSDDSITLEEQTDAFLQYLLSIPFEHRQYIFPALFDSPNVPKKIRTHPEIAIWEGKMPTDIAPEMREFADKHLKDLSPTLYAYLAPRGAEGNVDLPAKNQAIPLFQNQMNGTVDANISHYPTLQEALEPAEDLKKNPDLARLSFNDIAKVEAGLEAFGNYLTEYVENDFAVTENLKKAANYLKDSHQGKINPFQTEIKRLKLVQQTDKLEEELKKAGFKSAEDFADKADTLARAYRAARMPYPVASQVRLYKGKVPQNKTEKALITAAKMYESYPKDVHLVLDNLNAVREVFIKTGFQGALDAETFDELRK